ncbi:MAG TPA: hypothetical protein VFS08_05800 [Gemmatimonadaceae bacterium]|nr:hypothetical protein [Gemmatimonadaceae bacterium]
MKPTTAWLVAGAATAALLWGAARARPPVLPEPDAAALVAARAAADSLTVRRAREIALYERRAREDTMSAADLAQLAGLFLQRSRETGSYEDFRRAERTARRSLALRTSRNEKTLLTLASSLLAQHHFADARTVAQALVARDPDRASYRALLAEIHLELGAYDSAAHHFALLRPARAELAVAPRLARWAELQGRTDEARRILYDARDAATRRADLPREQLAWFHLRVADLELRNGRLREATRALAAGLAVDPLDRRLLAAAARLAAARRDWRGVLAWGARAGAGADIATLALMGDAHRALGDSVAAERCYAAAEHAAAVTPEPFNRQWTLFRLDHGRALPATLRLLQREIRQRPDVYGWDQLAWALLLNGRPEDARAAMAPALRLGTRDAMLLAHAAAIARATGHDAEARRYADAARAVNPHLWPLPQAPAPRAPAQLAGGPR